MNKLWNIARFTFMTPRPKTKLEVKTLADQWILSELNTLTKEVTEDLDNFEFSKGTEKLYEFIWHKFADWYLEISKLEKNHAITYHVLENILKLLHPFAPFITEEIWQKLNPKKMLLITEWPKADSKLINKKTSTEFTRLQDLIIHLRNEKKEKGLSPKDEYIVKKKKSSLLEENKVIIEWLARVKVELK